MTLQAPSHDRRQRRMLIALALFFFAPLAVSFYLYYGSGGWRPAKHVNRGELIDPARPLPAAALRFARNEVGAAPRVDGIDGVDGIARDHTSTGFLRSKWTLLYFGSGSCETRCRTQLYDTRQVRIALNRDMSRVQRVFIAQDPCCDWLFLEHEHPDLITVRADGDAAALLALLPTFDGIDPAAAGRIYLVDPLGNLLMSYAPGSNPKGMLEDLKRLLGLSQVG